MSPVLPAGTPVSLIGAGPQFKTLRAPDVDARNAMAQALVNFLACITFERGPGPSGEGERVQFTIPSNAIYRVWPEPSRTLPELAAVVLDMGDVDEDAAGFVPTPLEETLDVFCKGSVLWKVAEVSATFQLDLWADNDANREAMLKQLPGAFSPDEQRYGIVLSTGPQFFGMPARFTLLSTQRMDTPSSVYPRERRLMCVIRGDVDDVVLRSATLGSFRTNVVVDPQAEPTQEKSP